jgi:hypothetical protein
MCVATTIFVEARTHDGPATPPTHTVSVAQPKSSQWLLAYAALMTASRGTCELRSGNNRGTLKRRKQPK